MFISILTWHVTKIKELFLQTICQADRQGVDLPWLSAKNSHRMLVKMNAIHTAYVEIIVINIL